MAEGILGLGAGQAASLNNDLIDKLKAVDKKATIDPLERRLENFPKEREVISNISAKVDDFLNALKVFSLNQTTGTNAFHQKSANITGDGVAFDADDLSSLKVGSLSVKVEQLAQKDVWQSKLIDENIVEEEITENGKKITKERDVDKGKLKINGTEIDTNGKTYRKLVEEINKIDGVQASLVENSNGDFKLSIKSMETGASNKINFTGSDTSALTHFGFDDTTNNVLPAQDMKMTVDGVEYSNSTNSIIVDGLKITATKATGESTISIENDKTNLSKQMQEFANKFNDLRAEIEDEIYSTTPNVQDRSSLRNMLSQIKQELFGSGNSNQSIFNFGFSFDERSGNLNFNANEFDKSIKNGTQELEKLFAGTPDKKGIATSLDEAINISGVKKGLLDYEINMISREQALQKEKDTAQEKLDRKYSLMAQQFASYGVIINQMEQSFAGLRMMIQQSVASK